MSTATRDRRHVRHAAPVVTTPVLDVNAVASDLSGDAKTLLTWLAEHPNTQASWEELGMTGERLQRAFLTLEDRGLVRQVPSSPSEVVIPRSVMIAILPPNYITNMIGRIPQNSESAAAWKSAVEAIETYRTQWGIVDTRHAMGGGQVVMHGKDQQEAAIATWATIHAFRAVVRQTAVHDRELG